MVRRYYNRREGGDQNDFQNQTRFDNTSAGGYDSFRLNLNVSNSFRNPSEPGIFADACGQSTKFYFVIHQVFLDERFKYHNLCNSR